MVRNSNARLRSGPGSASPTGSSNRTRREDRQKDATRDIEDSKRRCPEMEWKQLVTGRGTARWAGGRFSKGQRLKEADRGAEEWENVSPGDIRSRIGSSKKPLATSRVRK